MILLSAYGDIHPRAVRAGDSMRVLVKAPDDDNAWAGNIAIKTSLSAIATDTASLSSYTGKKVNNRSFDLYADYDTSGLSANTKYLVIAEVTHGSKVREYIWSIDVLPGGA